MFCPKCGSKVEEMWQFCPKCGSPVLKPVQAGKPAFGRLFSFDDIFEGFEKQMSELRKQMHKDIGFKDIGGIDKDIEFFDVRPKADERSGVKKSGFNISIRTGTGMKPIVNVRTFGDVNKKNLEDEIAKKFGFVILPAGRELPGAKAVPEQQRPVPGVKREMPKVTEEPKTEIHRLPNEVIIEAKLPGVDEKNIEITKHTESIEIRALSKEKLYFKIIQIPLNWELKSRELKGGVLRIVISP